MTDGAVDLRKALDSRPMHRLQVAVVAMCIALNALDGYDVVSISLAAPGVAAEWGIDRALLGVVLSLELLGMAAGSVLIGMIADRIGRRRAILLCMILVSVGMFLSAAAGDVAFLSATRLVTGLGIGGIYATGSAMVAEWSNARYRSVNLVLNVVGVSAGVILGGTAASLLLRETGDWRSVFMLGGAMTALFVPLVYLYMPESLDWLVARRPAGALDKVQRTLRRLDMPPIEQLPVPPASIAKASIGSLFSPSLAPVTLLLTIIYFNAILCYYYLQKWIPKMVVDMGFDPAAGGGVLVAGNIGGFLGGLAMGLASLRYPLRSFIMASLVIAFPAIAFFGMDHDSVWRLSLVAAVASFFLFGGIVGLFPIIAQTYPAALRAGGTGFVIGIGRGGSAVGPMIAGALLAAGYSMFAVSSVIGAATLVAAALLALLPWAESRCRAALPSREAAGGA